MWEDVQIVWRPLAVVVLVLLSPHADVTPTLRWSDDLALALAAVLPLPGHLQNSQLLVQAQGLPALSPCLPPHLKHDHVR